MNKTIRVFAILLLATALFHTTLNFMVDNIEDFETTALPPKKPQKKITSSNPILTIDAKSKDTWVLVSFSTGKMLTVNDLDKDKDQLSLLDWDLGFQRTKIITNGGVTNPSGNVGVINLGAVDFNSIHEAPSETLVQDSRSFGKVLNKAISDWYNYRTRTHNIESKKNVYVVKTSSGRFMKMRILNYYCSNEEQDCRSMMCTRENAACLTVEYVLSQDQSAKFPAAPSVKMARNS